MKAVIGAIAVAVIMGEFCLRSIAGRQSDPVNFGQAWSCVWLDLIVHVDYIPGNKKNRRNAYAIAQCSGIYHFVSWNCSGFRLQA
tara:strand:- start:364 stop:618 length:255 start_codon:yes stop_codon:yes gene_type:complete